MADCSRKAMRDAIDKRVNAKMAARTGVPQGYQIEALREERGPETPATQAKLEELEALSQRGARRIGAAAAAPADRCARSSAKRLRSKRCSRRLARRIRST